ERSGQVSRDASRAAEPAGEAAAQYVSFWVGGQLLGVPVRHVQEVLNPQTIAPVPRSRSEVAGLLNLRGQIVTAVDLRRRLGLPPRVGETAAMNVVVRHEGESFSLLVDEVGDVIDAPAESLEPPPRTLDTRYKAVTQGVFRLDDRLFVILGIPAVLTLG
ncbi:MAG TPA: chemotaxis protein CheW, partial [Planctomycetaceae bacterium]